MAFGLLSLATAFILVQHLFFLYGRVRDDFSLRNLEQPWAWLFGAAAMFCQSMSLPLHLVGFWLLVRGVVRVSQGRRLIN